MGLRMSDVDMKVNCRIGSLESRNSGAYRRQLVNCRIGSLEMRRSELLGLRIS